MMAREVLIILFATLTLVACASVEPASTPTSDATPSPHLIESSPENPCPVVGEPLPGAWTAHVRSGFENRFNYLSADMDSVKVYAERGATVVGVWGDLSGMGAPSPGCAPGFFFKVVPTSKGCDLENDGFVIC